MVASSHRDEIDESSKVLKAFRRSSELFANEKEILGLEKQRYILYYSQIHEVLAPRRRDESESEILELIRQIYGLDIPVCEAKIKRFQDGLEKCERTGNDRYINNYYAYLQEWLGLYESFYALIAFRSFEHFAIFMEWDKSESEKVWAPSLDPYHDNGYTGVSKPFFYFFNQMVLGKKIKFISKQMFTGAGKCVVPTTEVLTPSGTRMIKDINVGDYVYSMKDNEICERRVTNKWFSKKKQVTLTTRGGEEITVSPEHKMLTQRGYVMASEITENDYLYRLCAKLKTGQEVPINDDELVFATCMLFDGHCKKGAYSFTKMPNTEIAKVFCNACKNLGIKVSKRKKAGTDCITYAVLQNGGIANKIMAKYGLEGKLSKEKRLPRQFFDMPLEQKYKFIGLMFATDGYISKKSFAGITSASKGLAIDIRKLFDMCGIYSTVTPKTCHCNGKEFSAFVVGISTEYVPIIYNNCYCYDKQEGLTELYRDACPNAYSNNTNYPKELLANSVLFRKKHKTSWKRNATYKKAIVEEHYRQTGEFADIIYKDFVWERIKKIEYCEETTDMIDIEVEETHNFIANHLVSHNSFSNQYAFAWLLGIDKNVDILDVVGNPSNVLPNTSGTVDLMINPRYARVFPEYAQFFGEEYNADAVREAMFATCKINMGEIKVTGSRKINLRVCSKDKKVNGVRCKFLFLDDICQSEDSANLKAHQEDINRFWKDWFRRQYNNVDFYIVVSGTAYSVNDIMSHLIGYYSKGKMFRTKENKYTYASQDGTAIFIKIPKIDEDFDRSTYPQKFPYEEAIKLRDLDLNTFLAMEQQRPQNPETSPLSYDKINTYEELPTGLSEGAFACLDPARTGKNFVTMGIHRIKIEVDKFNAQVEKHYFVDCVFQLKQMADLYETICEKVIRHHIIKLHIENNTDTSLAYLIEKMLHEKGIFFCEISEVFSRENKEEKIRELVYGNEGYFKNQMVYPALNLYAPSSEIGKFMLYLTGYDYYKKQEYDDSIDEECMYIKKFLAKSKDKPKAKILYV